MDIVGVIGARLANAPPTGTNLTPVGPSSPEAAQTATAEGPSFVDMLQAFGEELDVAANTEAPKPMDDAASAQLVALAALVMQITGVVQLNDAGQNLAETLTPPPAMNAATPEALPMLTAAEVELAAGVVGRGQPAEGESSEVPASFTAALAAVPTGQIVAEAAPELATLVGLEALQSKLGLADQAKDAPPPVTMDPSVTAEAAAIVKPENTAGQPLESAAKAAVADAFVVRDAEPIRVAREPQVGPAHMTPSQGHTDATLAAGAATVTSPVEHFSLGEPARLAEAQPLFDLTEAQATIAAITRSAARMMKNGENGLRLQLRPEGLGRIELQITHQTEGVRVALVAEVAATAGLLDRHLDDLRQSLSSAGISLTSLSVGDGSSQQQAAGSQSEHGRSGQPPTPGHLPAGHPAQRAHARSDEPSGLVDYWI
jgi:flagellar hook-length control protein FliK